MKILLSIALALSFALTLSAQDCNYKRNVLDDFTGERSVVMMPQVIGQSTESKLKLKYQHVKVGASEAAFFTLSYDINVGCASSRSYIQIKWDDGTTSRHENQGKADCGDSPSMMITFFDKEMNDIMDDFTSKLPEMIRLHYTDGYITFNVTDNQVIRRQANCANK